MKASKLIQTLPHLPTWDDPTGTLWRLLSEQLDIPLPRLRWEDRELTDEQAQAFQCGAARLANDEPLAYVSGKVWFMGIKLAIDHRALIPRPDTETLVQTILTTEQTGHWLEIGTGSGAIAIALALRGFQMTATDISENALTLARENARRHNVNIRWVQGDLTAGVSGLFDGIVSNPPYIAADVLKTLPDLKWEPETALNGGADGLDFYRRLAECGYLLKAGGRLFLEIGYDQGSAIRGILEAAGWHDITIIKDLGGCDRVVCACNIV